MLHAQPSATTSSFCLCVQSWGPWSSTSHRRQQTGAVGPSHATTLHHVPCVHTYTRTDPDPENSNPTQPTQSKTRPGRQRFSLSPALPGNIIIIPKQHTQPDPLACSLVRWFAPTHPHPHHTARNTPAEAAEQNTPIGSVFIYCTSTVFPACSLTAWLACICIPYLYQTTTPHHDRFPRHPSLATCSYKTAPEFPFSRPNLLLLAAQRTSITRLAPRPCLFDPFTRPLSQKGALIPLPIRGRAFLTSQVVTSPTTVTLVPAARPRNLCDQPPTHPLRDLHSSTHAIATNIQPSP